MPIFALKYHHKEERTSTISIGRAPLYSIQKEERRTESLSAVSLSLSLVRGDKAARHRWINGSSVVEEDRRSQVARNTHARCHTRHRMNFEKKEQQRSSDGQTEISLDQNVEP